MGQTDVMTSLYDVMRGTHYFCRIPTRNAQCQSSETSGKLRLNDCNGYRISVLQDEKNFRNYLYNSVNIYNTTEVYI